MDHVRRRKLGCCREVAVNGGSTVFTIISSLNKAIYFWKKVQQLCAGYLTSLMKIVFDCPHFETEKFPPSWSFRRKIKT